MQHTKTHNVKKINILCHKCTLPPQKRFSSWDKKDFRISLKYEWFCTSEQNAYYILYSFELKSMFQNYRPYSLLWRTIFINRSHKEVFMCISRALMFLTVVKALLFLYVSLLIGIYGSREFFIWTKLQYSIQDPKLYLIETHVLFFIHKYTQQGQNFIHHYLKEKITIFIKSCVRFYSKISASKFNKI